MIRLNPAHPPLWRSGTVVQFGVPAVAVLRDPLPWQERLVRELESGLTAEAADSLAEAWGASRGECSMLLSELAPALTPPPPASSGGRFIVVGGDGVPPSATHAVTEGVAAGGGRVTGPEPRSARRWTALGTPRDIVVVVANHLLHPAIAGILLSRDVPHIPVALQGDRIEIGPLIAPGRTACAACIADERTDEDPAWPVLAAQLVTRDAGPARPALLWEAGLVAVELIAQDADARGSLSRSVTVRSGSLSRTVREHLPSAGCGCRSLGGTGTADDRGTLGPTSERAFAQPA